MRATNYFLLLPLATSILLTSCGGDKTDDAEAALTDSVKVDSALVNQSAEMFVQVPSPGEMLTFIKQIGGKTNKNTSFLNPPDNQKNYADTKAKALNFGVYACDLSYCSVFEIGADAIKYFKVVKTLGDQIGVSSAIKPEILKRLEGNIGVPDSLAVISDDVYFSSFETLENAKQGSTLALVVAGGWIESIYIASNLTKYAENSPIVERFADQKFTLENVIDFLKKYESDANVASVIIPLNELKAEFEKISEKEVGALDVKDNKGKKILGGGKQLVISESQFKAISEKIKSIRNSFTQIK